MGRAPCCDKANVKKGPWSPEEDAKLKSYIEEHGTGGNWIALPQKIGLKRCGKSCRLRWLNYLRPNIKHGGFSEEEDNIICSLYISIGSRWSIIAAQLPGRTDNDIKNYWNTRLKKKLLGKQRKDQLQARKALKQGPKRAGIDNINGIINNSMEIINPESNTTTSNIMNINNQSPYWPELPVLAPLPYSSEIQQHRDNHASIRKLLIKLGGRFSDDDNNHNHNQPIIHEVGSSTDPNNSGQYLFPIDSIHSSGTSTTTTQQVYELSGDMSSSAPPVFGNQAGQYYTDYAAVSGSSQILLQAGQSSTTSTTTTSVAEFEERVLYNEPGQVLDGLEFLYGDNTSSTNYGWGDHQMMSSFAYSSSTIVPLASDFEGMQIMSESSTFPEAQ